MMEERKEMSSTVMQLRDRCLSLEKDLENMVKLFFVYHKHLDSKVTKAKHSVDLSLDFIQSLTVQIDQLKLIIETHGHLPDNLSESLKKDLNALESSPNSNSTQKSHVLPSCKPRHRPTASQSKASQGKLLDSILERKDVMVTELKESKNLLSLISEYLKKIQHEEEETGRVMEPEKILKIVDMDHLLKNTTDFFSTQMKSQHQEKDDRIALLTSYSQVMEDNLQKISEGIKEEKGLKYSLKKIAQLQKDLKKKKETILKLTTELRKLGKRVTVKNLNRYDESGDNLEDEDNQSVILHVENEEEWRNLEEENRLLLEELEALRSKLTENSEHYLEAEQNYKELQERMSHELDTLNREKRTLAEKENKMFEKLMALQDENGAFKGEHSRIREDSQRLRAEMSDLQSSNRALNEKLVQLTANCEVKEELLEECQNARNCFIELEASYKELLGEIESWRKKDREGYLIRQVVEDKLAEVEMIIEVLKEKNEHLEEENGLVTERNGFLEDTLTNQRKETGVIFEENCALKLKLIELQKHSSHQNEGDEQMESGMNQLFSEEYEKVVGENSRLLSDMDSFRKTIHSLRQENKLLFAQIKELKSRGNRRSVSQVALDQNRSLETSIFEQRLQPEGDHDLLPLVLLQALFIEKQFHS